MPVTPARALRLALAFGLACALVLAAACTGDDGGDATATPGAATVVATPSGGATAVATQGSGERLQVVASTGILADLASRVGGDDAEVSAVIPPGADVHSFSPSPDAARRIAEADVVIVNGYNLEESTLDVILGNRASDAVLVVAALGISALEGGHDHHDHGHEDEHGHADEDGDDHAHEDEDDDHAHEDEDDHADEDEDDHADEDGDDHAHEDEDDHADEDGDDHAHEDGDDHADEDGDDHADEDGDDHAHEDEDDHADEDGDDHADEDGDDHAHEDEDDHAGEAVGDDLARASGDPHMWLSVPHAMVHVRNIANALAAADPANAAAYREREEAYLAELQAVDEEVRAAIASIPREQRVLVVFHDAFQYFTVEYGLELAAAVLPGSPSQQASAGEVAEIVDLVRELGVPAVYREPQFAADALEAIAEATGARVLTLYSGALTDEVGDYASLMRANARALADGLGGG